MSNATKKELHDLCQTVLQEMGLSITAWILFLEGPGQKFVVYKDDRANLLPAAVEFCRRYNGIAATFVMAAMELHAALVGGIHLRQASPESEE